MNERFRDILDHTLIYGGLLMAAIGITGEILGWWGELGLVLTIGGFLAGILGAIDANGRRLLALATETLVPNQQAMLSNQGSMLSNQEDMLSNQGSMLSNQEAMLSNQERMLTKQDGTNERLDRIVEILDDRLPSA